MNIIHALIKVKHEHREDFLNAVQPLIEGSQREEGNIRYELFEHTKDKNSFVVVEEWQDMDAIKFHNNTPHYKEFGKTSSVYLAEPPQVSIFEASRLK